jgi:CheY-like chemotaxis protein
VNPLALVVENDANTRRLLEVVLMRFGFDVDPVSNGMDALLLLPVIDYDAVFLDLALPGAQGVDVLARLAALRPEALARCAVVSSASTLQLDRVRQQWPDVRVIRKPFELGEIVETAQKLTAGREPRTATLEELFARRSIALGAKAGVVALCHDDILEPVVTFGYTRAMIETFAPIRVGDSYPLSLAARDARPVWLSSTVTATAEYPMLARALEHSDSRALAAVPLVRDGRSVGAIGWSFREPHLFAEAEQRAFREVSEMMARGIDRPQSIGPTHA